jgi:ABC-type antimicrobial peptide transport system permease subunit
VVTLGRGSEILGGPFTLVRFIGNSALSLGMVTLLLAMVGLYGIQSQAVSLRTREIGVRLSFGATAAQMKRMVLTDSYRPVLEGLVLGLAGGITGRVMLIAYLDVPLSVVDPWMLALVPMPLVLAAFCAGYLPARRAARVNPGVALRDQ